MKNSLAIWYENKDESEKQSKKLNLKQLHLNLWDLEEEIYLDIGIKTDPADRPSIIKIYVPFVIDADRVDKKELKDLGKIIGSSETLITGIFNEDYNVSVKTNVLGCKSFENTVRTDDSFALCWPDDDESVELKCKTFKCKKGEITGSIVSLDINKLKGFEEESLYFRIRIISNSLRAFYHDYEPGDSFLNSAFVKTEIMDLKVNDKRTLPPNLPFMKKEVKIDHLHFLLLRKASDDLIYSHSTDVRSRVLEKEIWEEYVEKPIKEKIIAYHWKIKNKNDGGQFYSKIKSRNSDKRTILKYVLIAFIFAVFCNIVASFLFNFVECSCFKVIMKIINYVEGL